MSEGGAVRGWWAGLSGLNKVLCLLLLPFVVGGLVGLVMRMTAGGSGQVSGVENAAVVVGAQDLRSDDAQALPCPCSAGVWCQGPRGGLYCITDTGRKRYAQR